MTPRPLCAGSSARSALRGETVGHGTYLSVGTDSEVDEVYATAVEAGATSVWEPANTPWGNYRCRVHDLEGFEWTFGTLRPGESSGDWPEGE